MRSWLLAGVVLVCVPALHAQGGESPPPEPLPRFFTLTAGIGNSHGGIGLQAEKYLANTRLSVFAAVGYTPEEEEGDYHGAGVAAGLRGFTTGVKHRGFLELSVAQLFVQESCFDTCESRYGPGLLAGWQLVTRGGFTLLLSLGVGVAFDPPPGRDDVAPMGAIGLGYTWRR
jgi:hypothetical protein